MLATLLAAVLTASPPAADPLTLKATSTKLDNGLTLILSPDHAVPGVAVYLTYLVGSRDEVVGRTGFAHLFEHLMFMGSTHVPYPQYDTLMEAAGGQNNANTSNDRTNYYELGPSNLLETFLWMEADRLQTLPDTMDDAKVTAQRLVVQNERRQSYENRAYGTAELAMFSALYPPEHPYSWPVIGSHADLEAASTQDVKNFFHRFYTPSNVILTIVGDFEPDLATDLVRKYFGWMPARPPGLRPVPPQPRLAEAKRLDLNDRVELPKAILAYHSPPEGTQGDAECDLLGIILGGGKASRLHQALVYSQQISQETAAGQNNLKLGSVFEIDLLATPGHSAEEEIAAADAVISRLKQEGPTEAELEAARRQVRTGFAHRIEQLVGRAGLLSHTQELFGSPTALDRDLARYDQATAESLKARANEVLVPQRVVIVVHPAPQAPAAEGQP
jgi:zinc protease